LFDLDPIILKGVTTGWDAQIACRVARVEYARIADSAQDQAQGLARLQWDLLLDGIQTALAKALQFIVGQATTLGQGDLQAIGPSSPPGRYSESQA